MNHLFIYTPYYNFPHRHKTFMLRQGLEPVLDPTVIGPTGSYTTNGRCGHRVSPDQTRGVTFHANSGTTLTWSFVVTPTGLTYTATTGVFSGEVNDCFAGNTYYGFGGSTTSIITVFRTSDNSAVTVSKTGLGVIYRMSLHPDGNRLAVSHSTSPYLRVYNLSAGTYVDAATQSVTAGSCSWTGDGNNVVVNGNATPYVCKFDAGLTTRTVISTNAAHATNISILSGYGSQNSGLMNPHPNKPTCVIMHRPDNGAPSMYEVDAATNSIVTTIAATTPTLVQSWVFDTKFNKIYTTQITDTYNNDGFRRYNGTTYLEEDMTGASFAMSSGAPTAIATGMMIINGNTGTIAGTVRNASNTPVARTVRAYRRSDGLLVGETVSNGTTGDFSLIVPTSDTEAYDVQVITGAGETLNDLFYSRVTPQAVP